MANKKIEIEQPGPDEVQIGIMLMTDFLLLTQWKTKRMGKHIVDLTTAADYRPVFVKRSEYEEEL